MKFEFEIPDEDIKELISKEVKSITEPSSFRHRSPLNDHIEDTLDRVVKRRLERVLESDEVITMIDEVIKVQADNALSKVSDDKVEGWIKRNIKEMLKYAKYRFLDEANSQ